MLKAYRIYLYGFCSSRLSVDPIIKSCAAETDVQ